MSKELTAFALVAEEYEKTGDPLRGLYPLFAPLLSEGKGHPFDPEKFSVSFTSAYGLEMSAFVASALAERMNDLGLLDREFDRNVGASYKVANFQWEAEPIAEAQVENTINLFVEWAEAQCQAYNKNIGSGVLEEAILARLARPEFASVFVTQSGEKNSRLRKIMGVAAVDVSAKDEAFLDYLVARFIIHVEENSPAVFDAISLISYGSLIADAVAGLAVTRTSGPSGRSLRLVFDAPLLMDLLDLNSSAHKQYAMGLIEIARDAGLQLATFDHCMEEVKFTIQATLDATARGEGYGPMANRIRTEPGKRLSATLVRDRLKTRVADLGITVLRADLYKEARYSKFFPEERVDQVRNAIGDLHEHLEARIRDAASVATVARLKQEKGDADELFDAGTIFVTRNSVLAKRVNRHLSKGRSSPSPTFVIATDGQIAGMLWFIRGMKGVELSRRRLIANCSAAILPKRELVSRISSILEGVQPELRQEFEVLMSDSRASLCVMRFTAGDVESVNGESSLELIEHMRAEISAPAVERAEAAEVRAGAAERRALDSQIELNSMSELAELDLIELKRIHQEQVDEKDRAQIKSELEVAQLRHDLDVARAADEQRVIDSNRAAVRRNKKIDGLEADLKGKRARVVKVVKYLSVFVSVSIPVLAFVFDTELVVKIISCLAAILSVGAVARWAEAFLERLSGRLFKADERLIEELRSAEFIV
ncbi:TPA: hypothetical protein ACJ509_000469 [Stenotrophomonas maltophilia]